jgi:putative NIF3 family GTP cyclohydrolase 1 type 2
LLLAGVRGVPADAPKGRLVHALVSHGTALLTLHTNADAARPGASDALADAVGLTATRPLRPATGEPMVKLVCFVPSDAAHRVLDAVSAAGAGRIEAYERCAWMTEGVGTFRPLPGAVPAVGQVDVVQEVPEVRLETVLPTGAVAGVVTALRATHPYEAPAYDLLPLVGSAADVGLGRIGDLPDPVPLEELLSRLVLALPSTVGGVRATGQPDQLVRTVAVCSGAGESLVAEARAAGADVYVTSDLRHHVASEATEQAWLDGQLGGRGLTLVDVAHWASEWLWLRAAAEQLAVDLPDLADIGVSTTNTDPWTLHAAIGSDDPED